ncbi:nucleotidyltransferase [Nitrosomonas sp.]|uniref:nucleotide-binding domain-containing protein n=1 Tax=Nitrosomonas sp. TaxID=42353 RepID=UPI0025CF46A8|nr:nucleotidyltransferase [Nitrosomonas sp.]
MSVSEMFQQFLDNLKIDNSAQISLRYEEITACLNKKFRDTESKAANNLQVGSYGRWTAIKGISDLDMLYIMPKGKWDDYKDGKQSQLLTDTKDAIKARYPNTTVYIDRLVVRVLYTNFHVEVQPVFEQDDESFKYPDTYCGGSWKITKPREEINAMSEFVTQKNKNLRRLCKMARAWKNKHGIGMSGLLIDTLAYNFLKSTNNYDNKSYLYYNHLSLDFFKYLANQENQDYYAALGSGQRVKVEQKFQRKAQKAHDLCLKAIEAKTFDNVNDRWKKVYGRPFPAKLTEARDYSIKATQNWKNTEQFIEDKYPVDIKYDLKIGCEVSRNGFRQHFLTEMLAKRIPLLAKRELLFTINKVSVPEPYSIEWKVLNRGEEAKKRNCVRGQIFSDGGRHSRRESTNFVGNHIVECYAIKDGVVVAKDRIDVPIR